MSKAVREHLRSNVIGYVAVFIALSGTAVALPGKNKVDSGDIKKNQVKSSDIGGGQVKESDIAAGAVTSAAILDGTIAAADVGTNALGGAQIDESSLDLPAQQQQQIPTSLPPNGTAGGDLAGTYPNPTIGANAVGTAEVDGTLTGADVAANALGTGAIDESTLFNDDSLVAGDLAPNSVGASEVADNAVGSVEAGGDDEIADNAVESEDVNNNSLTGTDINETNLNADLVDGVHMSMNRVTVPDGDVGTLASVGPIALNASCPGSNARLVVANQAPGTNPIEMFYDGGNSAPVLGQIPAGIGMFTFQDPSDPDLVTVQLTELGGSATMTAFIGVDEIGGDCNFSARVLAQP